MNGLRIAFFVGVLIQATSSPALSQSLQSASLPDEVEAMSLILQNISDITLYEYVPDPRDERLIPWNTPLVRVLATHLLSNDHLSGTVGETAILTNSSISITEHKRSAERIHARIQLILGDGDYLRSESGYVGPRTESSILILFPITIDRATGEATIDDLSGYVLFAG